MPDCEVKNVTNAKATMRLCSAQRFEADVDKVKILHNRLLRQIILQCHGDLVLDAQKRNVNPTIGH